MILAYLSKEFNKPCVNSLRDCTKKTIYWKLWECFQKFWNIFFGKLLKCIISAYFSNKLTISALGFCAFGRKTHIVRKFWDNFEIFWWKFYRKIEFFIFYFYYLFFFENLLLKIELSEITPFFYNNFFRFREGGFPPFPAWLRPWSLSGYYFHGIL